MPRREDLYAVAGGLLVGAGLIGLWWEWVLRGTRDLEQRARALTREEAHSWR